MKIIHTNFENLFLIYSQLHMDKRGSLKEFFNKKQFNFDCKFQYFSNSKKNVFRGFHFQLPQQSKIVTVVKGEIIDYCLDLRKNSKTFLQIFSTKLKPNQISSIIIPKGFAHAFLSLSNENIILYTNDNYRNSKKEYGINFLDQKISIKLPKNIIVSEKDKKNMYLNEFFSIYGSL
jgi:dTDP-4-dehydrorhamnose 3,5-epimerase